MPVKEIGGVAKGAADAATEAVKKTPPPADNEAKKTPTPKPENKKKGKDDKDDKKAGEEDKSALKPKGPPEVKGVGILAGQADFLKTGQEIGEAVKDKAKAIGGILLDTGKKALDMMKGSDSKPEPKPEVEDKQLNKASAESQPPTTGADAGVNAGVGAPQDASDVSADDAPTPS